jgi:hypothetical protein
MRKTIATLLVFGVAAFAGDESPCTGCKGTAKEPTALSKARDAIAGIPKADEKLPADQLAKVKAAREALSQTTFGKAMGPAFETCGLLLAAAAAQPGTSPEAAAVMKDMGATYCTLTNKMFGGCTLCDCCSEEECAKECKAMPAEALAKKAKDAVAATKKSFEAAMAECATMTPEQGQKMMADVKTLQELSPCWKAMETATAALNDGFASLAKMGIPSTDAKDAARNDLVKAAMELHTQLTACSGEECQEECAEECEEAKKPAVAPEKSS